MDYLSPEEATRILGISQRQLQREVRKGMLRSYRPKNQRDSYYDANEVAALAEVRAKGRNLLPEMTMLAHRAYMNTMRLERQVKRLTELAGADLPLLELDEESVVSLYLKAQDATERYQTPQEVEEWARVFCSMGEEYFDALSQYTGHADPWKLFIDLGRIIGERAPHQLIAEDIEVRSIYQCFRVARGELRRTAALYVELRHGKTLSSQIFPNSKGDFHEKVLTLVADKKKRAAGA